MYRAIASVDRPNVVLSFKEWRYPIAVKLDRPLAGVVTANRESYVAAKPIQQPSKISGSAQNVFTRSKMFFTAESGRRRRPSTA